jgi:hypothetical protein
VLGVYLGDGLVSVCLTRVQVDVPVLSLDGIPDVGIELLHGVEDGGDHCLLVVPPGFVPREVIEAVLVEDGADVGVFELDSSLRAVVEIGEEVSVVLGLHVVPTVDLLGEHVEVVGDDGLDFGR